MAAGLKRKPNIKANPISTNPQAFKTSMVASRSAFDKIHLAKPDRIPCDSCRKSADVHWGLITFDIPSYNTCHPMANLSVSRNIN